MLGITLFILGFFVYVTIAALLRRTIVNGKGKFTLWLYEKDFHSHTFGWPFFPFVLLLLGLFMWYDLIAGD